MLLPDQPGGLYWPRMFKGVDITEKEGSGLIFNDTIDNNLNLQEPF